LYAIILGYSSIATVPYAENFDWGVSFSGIWWSFVNGLRGLWHHNLTSYSCFQTNVLAKFVDTICIFFSTHCPYFMCLYTEYKLSALQVRMSEKIHSTLRHHLTTTNIPGYALKQGSETHSSLRQSKLQQRSQAALSQRIRAVEHRYAAGLAGAHSGLQDRILPNYTRIENAHKVRKKTFGFWLCIEIQQTFSFPFSLLRHCQMPECFYVNNCCFWARAI